MEGFKIAQKIEEKIQLLEVGRSELLEKAKFKAETISNYERKIAIVLIKLKNGEPLSLDGNVIEKSPASIMEKIAKGICWEEKLQMELAEAEYKIVVDKLRSVQAELNGFQSMNRHLDSI